MPPSKPVGGRAGFLDAKLTAAICETIKKEERTLHKLLQTQIDLGRIVLPQEPDAGGDEAGAAAAAAEHQQRVAARLEALKAVQHGAAGGQPAADQGGCEGPQAAKEPADGDAAAAAQQARLRAQMQDISRALWSSVSAGNASGQGSWTSRSKADYAYNGEAIAAMKRGGELDDRHHRRRDAHTAHMEAQARDAALRRGAAAGSPAAK